MKSMSRLSTFTGLSVLVRSSSTCNGVNTQRFVDSDPHTSLPVLVESVTSSCFSWLRVSWSKIVRFSISFVDSLHHKRVSPYLISVFFGLGWIRWLSLLLPLSSESKSYMQLSWSKIIGGLEATHVPSGIWLLFRFHHSSFRDTLSWWCIVEDDFVRSCLTCILSVVQPVVRPNTPYPGAFSTLACTVQDVVWLNGALADLCVPRPWEVKQWKLSVIPYNNSVLPLSNLNLRWSVHWLHTQNGNFTRRNCTELTLSNSAGSMGSRPDRPRRARK